MSLRTALLVLAFVPGIALAALWAVTSGQTLLDFQRQADLGLLSEKAGNPSNIVYYNLQAERRLSAEVLAGQDGAAEALARQRKATDEAVEVFRTLSDDLSSADDAPREVRDAVGEARTAIDRLPAQRSLVDSGDQDQQEAVYRYYTDLIAVDLELFTSLSHVDNGRITVLAQPLVDLFWTKEMISRSDALLARSWDGGTLTADERRQFRDAVAAQSFLHTVKVGPQLPGDERAMWRRIVDSEAWKDKTRLERAVLDRGEPGARGPVDLEADRRTWREAMDTLTPEIEELLEHRTALVDEEGKASVMALLRRMLVTTAVGLAAVVAVIWTTWRLTRSLRQRIGGLQEQAETLEAALPDVVERLARGERIDVETEARAIHHDGTTDRTADELTRLGTALNLARTSALQAAVRQADQHRGFERLLQRVARRTQQLIGQQLKKLDEMERRHEDSEILDGLFDLDHLTARLRRYEENLVILSGGTPHRRWRKPVALLDVARSAQGEVQDYRRVLIDLEGGTWLAARAVGPVAHVLAELIENALTFSPPSSPVEVRAAEVGRGLVVEVEDRGLGMDEERLAEANGLMARPPRLDVLAHSDDIRLGLHVVARLANQYGLGVEFRASAYGGTRAVVFVPSELVVPAPQQGPVAVPAPDRAPAPGPVSVPGPAPAQAVEETLPMRVQGRAMADVTALHPTTRPVSPGPRPHRDPHRPHTPEAPGVPEAPHSSREHGRDAGQRSDGTHTSGPAPDHGAGTAPYGTAPARPGPAGEPRPAHGAPDAAPRRPHTGAGTGGAPDLTGDEAPLPRRVRQASLADELRVDPARTPPPRPPRWQDDPLLRPAPRRAGATIGAFQRRSRAAREGWTPTPPEPGAPRRVMREEEGS
ncbi:nitrate- and nitrite sensing domain-containing protein [Streptomyces prasinosporus]|uniref:histidine kinase n=1 Tax=Streptomyces prasinosporus TaxID=68256 RepID=A0ABP6TK88_9ACTN